MSACRPEYVCPVCLGHEDGFKVSITMQATDAIDATGQTDELGDGDRYWDGMECAACGYSASPEEFMVDTDKNAPVEAPGVSATVNGRLKAFPTRGAAAREILRSAGMALDDPDAKKTLEDSGMTDIVLCGMEKE